ncbi:MAG: heme-binding protein [Candidatus Hydrogenedentota bacterium]|nr:MAG: heme-binding protein [Candidatus Hydrogenedentota bacterium]
MTKIILILLSSIVISLFLFSSCATVGIEKAKYKVIEKEGKFEIRQYQPQIIAETIVDADFDKAGNMAFRRLFNYISGQNRKKESIAMTAPVNQKARSEKMAMTAPVNQQKSEGKYSVSFLMPSKYTLDTLPEPLDSNVRLTEIPARKMAAIRYSGSWSRKRYEANKALLEEFIKKKGLQIIGKDIFARYDPPFQIWFLRRNEVLFPVE